MTYQFSPDGAVEINFNFQGGANQPDMFRLGMAMEIPKAYDQLTWYGLGPQETYWDRQRGAMTGIFTQSVKKDFFQYVMPQESTNHWKTRWASLTDKKGNGIKVSSNQPLSLSAWPYTMDDIEMAKHINELPDRDIITLNIDHLQQGVGGDNSWSPLGRPHKEFRIPCDDYQYKFIIQPIKN